MLENPLLIRRLPSISCLLGNQSPRCIKEADFIIRVWRSYDSDLPKVIQKVNDRLGNKLNLGNKSNQMQDLVLKELLFTSKKKNNSKQNIWGNLHLLQINQINFVLLAFFTVKERRWDKLYLDNTELAVFPRNPSIFV